MQNPAREGAAAKQTPWNRLCRATGVAPLRGSGVSRYGGGCSSGAPKALRGGYFFPQQRSMPVLTSLLSTPAIGLAEISVTPVSV